MFPTVNILGRNISTYAIMAGIGIAVVFIYSAIRCKIEKKKDYELTMLLVFSLVFLFIGAMFVFQLTNIENLKDCLPHLFTDFEYFKNHIRIGYVFYGGMLGTIFGAGLYAKICKNDARDLFNIALPAFILFQICGRIGCFLVGCCHGVENAALGIAYTNSIAAQNGVPYLPTQLYEVAGDIIIFIVVQIVGTRQKKLLTSLGLYLVLYSVMRFGLEFLRGDVVRGFAGALSTSQWISILVFPLGIHCLVASDEKNILGRWLNYRRKE